MRTKVFFGVLCSSFLLFNLASADAHAGDLKFRVRLVWGTNDPKGKHVDIEEVEPRLAERLRKVFRWDHYFKMKEDKLAVPDSEVKKVVLSDKCAVEVKNLGKSMLEVKLFGQGKLVKTVRQAMVPGDCLVLAGDDKNDSAWFVVLSPPAEEKK